MSAYIADRDALADVMGAMPEAYNVTDYTDEQTTMITAPVDSIADALIASGRIIDAATLADDEALVERVTRKFCEPALNEAMYADFTRDYLRALAAALTERTR